jgi:hypothetical protein
MASGLAVLLVGLEAALRAWRRSPRGPWATWLYPLVLLLLVATAAGGLGQVAAGARPNELLHFVYAVLAIGALPVVNSLSALANPRSGAVGTLLGAIVALVLILRLFATG